MSLKRYLFLLIALFVLTLSVTQLLFINYIQQQVAGEVEDKSQTLSKQALKILVNNLQDTEQPRTNRQFQPSQATTNRPITIEITHTPGKVIPLGDGYNFISGDQTQTVTISHAPAQPEREFRQLLQGQLQDIHFRRLGGPNAFAVFSEQAGQKAQHIVQFDKKSSVISQYFQWLIIGTVVLTALGLLLAYWLARHISTPLAALSDGFTRLQQGQLGSQVEPKGIQEVQATLNSFNQMSTRLAQLNKIETRFHQQQQMADLGEIARGLAHTLRNPINTIGLAIEQISQLNMPQDQRQDLAQQVRHKISHIDNTIKSLLTLTTSDLDRNQQINLNQVINDVLLEVSMYGKHQIAFSPVQDLHILGAQVEIRAMIHTLIINAIEASDEDQSISIFVSQTQQQICIQVCDQGKGLDAKIQTQLFKPHVSSKPEGAGMGLYIAKRISQSYYQGDVQLSNNQPKGCIATLCLSDHTDQGAAHE